MRTLSIFPVIMIALQFGTVSVLAVPAVPQTGGHDDMYYSEFGSTPGSPSFPPSNNGSLPLSNQSANQLVPRDGVWYHLTLVTSETTPGPRVHDLVDMRTHVPAANTPPVIEGRIARNPATGMLSHVYFESVPAQPMSSVPTWYAGASLNARWYELTLCPTPPANLDFDKLPKYPLQTYGVAEFSRTYASIPPVYILYSRTM
jgi:hypothetical protein